MHRNRNQNHIIYNELMKYFTLRKTLIHLLPKSCNPKSLSFLRHTHTHDTHTHTHIHIHTPVSDEMVHGSYIHTHTCIQIQTASFMTQHTQNMHMLSFIHLPCASDNTFFFIFFGLEPPVPVLLVLLLAGFALLALLLRFFLGGGDGERFSLPLFEDEALFLFFAFRLLLLVSLVCFSFFA